MQVEDGRDGEGFNDDEEEEEKGWAGVIRPAMQLIITSREGAQGTYDCNFVSNHLFRPTLHTKQPSQNEQTLKMSGIEEKRLNRKEKQERESLKSQIRLVNYRGDDEMGKHVPDFVSQRGGKVTGVDMEVLASQA
ncbi:hypothetical protein PoB_006505200 [Plakobranchus ocellatus]|uniref:Uncharacterized protein n=1 Tax=Plakobranchus ocellatus TaxID=259542 RepID=A0AAV4D304_9GAST|nr:hypothetical protein PoB_006505200 [Plakobranchus ocellatus]